MLKSSILAVSLVTMLGAGMAFADDKAKIDPGKGAGPTDAMNEAVPTMKPEVPATPGPATAAAPAAATPAAGAAAKVTCTQTELEAIITKAGALTDKDKQKMTMGHVELAQKSMGKKDMDACAMHLAAANTAMGTVTK